MPQPQPQPRPWWFWTLLGAGATGAAGMAGWFWMRRRRPEAEERFAEPDTSPAVPPAPVRGPNPALGLSPSAPATADPFEITVRPLRVQFGEREILIDLELVIANISGTAADAVRLSAVGISANPHQDAQIAGFHAGSQLAASAPPFDLAAGTAGTMPVQISLPRETLHVVDLGGRPMFVPILAIDVRWRGGLSIRRFGASFMLGTSGQNGKIGPIWLDRGQPRGPLGASRYVARIAAAA